MWPQALLSLGMELIGRLIPDPAAKAAAQLELMKLQQSGELVELQASKEIALAQAATNTAEASAGTFRGGWRPFIGWVCGASFAYTYLLRPLLPWLLTVAGIEAPDLPGLETGELTTLVMGMLGLGGLRTIEKMKAAA